MGQLLMPLLVFYKLSIIFTMPFLEDITGTTSKPHQIQGFQTASLAISFEAL